MTLPMSRNDCAPDRLCRFFLRQRLRQEFADDLDFLVFLRLEFGAPCLAIEPRAFLALLDHLGQDIEDFLLVRPVLALAAQRDVPVGDRRVDQPQRRNPASFLTLERRLQRL